MKLFHEPEGWQRLRAMAERAPDAHSLALIIDKMNCLLDEHQRTTESEHYDSLDSGMPAMRLETQASQYD